MLSHFSHIQFFVFLGTVALWALLSMGFSKQECWSGLPCPSPGALPNPGIEPVSLKNPALAEGLFIISATWEAPVLVYYFPIAALTNCHQFIGFSFSSVAQLCLTLCNPIDCSLQGSSVCGILQARILEWVVIPFSRRSSQPRD